MQSSGPGFVIGAGGGYNNVSRRIFLRLPTSICLSSSIANYACPRRIFNLACTMGTDEEKAACDTRAPSGPQSRNPSVQPRSDDGLQPRDIDVEVLGRQRPPIFKTLWSELGFCFSLVASMLMAVRHPLHPSPPFPPTDNPRNSS